VVAFLLGSLLTGIDRTVFGAADTVTSFFQALQLRDSTAVMTLMEDPAKTIATPAMIKDAGYQPPSSLHVDKVDAHFRQATVDVSYRVDGQTVQDKMDLTRVGYRAGVFSRWAIAATTSFPAIDVLIPTGGVVVAGRTFDQDSSLRHAPAIPGSYLVQVPDNPILSLHEQVPALPGKRTENAPLVASVQADAPTKAKSVLRSVFRKCARSTQVAPDGCPFSINAPCTALSVKWQLAQMPDVEVAQYPTGTDDLPPDATASIVEVKPLEPISMNYVVNCYEYGPYPGQTQVNDSVWTVDLSGGSVRLSVLDGGD
jgi:hypothetical protein